nr:hypothetical protein [Tanacetum cinerariifolium]
MESLNFNFQERQLHQLQQMQDNAKESCMVSFQPLRSHIKALSNNDLKGTCIKRGFKRAFMALFDQDIQTFTGLIRSRNDTHSDDADINSMNDKQPMAEVQLSAEHNILANEQLHSEQTKSVYNTYLLEKFDRTTAPESTDMSHRGGEIDQNADAKN